MIYFMIIASIIVADKILKEYFKSSFQGKHREVRTKGNGFGVRKEAGKQKVKENLFRKKEQNKAELKQKRNNKEKNDAAKGKIFTKMGKILEKGIGESIYLQRLNC